MTWLLRSSQKLNSKSAQAINLSERWLVRTLSKTRRFLSPNIHARDMTDQKVYFTLLMVPLFACSQFSATQGFEFPWQSRNEHKPNTENIAFHHRCKEKQANY